MEFTWRGVDSETCGGYGCVERGREPRACRLPDGCSTSPAGGVFHQTRDSYRFRQAAVGVVTPRLWTRHPSDPTARILCPSLRRLPFEAARGFWAGKIAAHPAHHCFGAWGRLPHLQLNFWRVGVKGSGSSMRLPVPAYPMLVRVATALLAGVTH